LHLESVKSDGTETNKNASAVAFMDLVSKRMEL